MFTRPGHFGEAFAATQLRFFLRIGSICRAESTAVLVVGDPSHDPEPRKVIHRAIGPPPVLLEVSLLFLLVLQLYAWNVPPSDSEHVQH